MTGGYDFWLFDLDGTLVDVGPSYIHETVATVGAEIGYEFSERQAVRLWRAIGGPPEAQLRSWGVDPADFWRAFHRLEDADARVRSTFLYPDAAVVGSLECPVGLVTHCQSHITEPVLRRLGIADWFDVVVCCGDDVGWKPNPDPIERAMRELGVGDSLGAMAGDSPADVGAAWNAGLDGVHVERVDPTDRGACVRADTRISTFADVFGAEG